MLTISLAFTILAVWLVIRNVNKSEILDVMRRMPAGPFAISFLYLIAAAIFRGLRLHALMRKTRSNLRAAMEMVVIGYFFFTILPLRAGELVRIGYFARRTGAPALSVATAAVVERAMDLIVLAMAAALLLSGVMGRAFPQLPVPPWAFGVAAVIGVLVAAVLGIAARRRIAAGKVESHNRLARHIDEVVRGLAALGSGKDAILALGLSVAVWIMVALSFREVFHAINMDLPLADASVIMLGTCFAIALPSAPGFIGTFDLGFVAAALLVGIPREISLPVGLMLHLTSQLGFLPIGGLVLFTGGRKALARKP